MKSYLLPALLAVMLTLASCASSPMPNPTIALRPASTASFTSNSQQTSAPVIDPLCSQVKIVLLSEADTTETIAATIANNAAIRAVCAK